MLGKCGGVVATAQGKRETWGCLGVSLRLWQPGWRWVKEIRTDRGRASRK